MLGVWTGTESGRRRIEVAVMYRSVVSLVGVDCVKMVYQPAYLTVFYQMTGVVLTSYAIL